MQFLVLAHDGTDSEAPARRMAARPAHIELGDKLRDSGNLLFATAILNESGEMIGSIMVLQYQSRDELDTWLKEEPYVTGDVWRSIDVRPCRVGPSFAKLVK